MKSTRFGTVVAGALTVIVALASALLFVVVARTSIADIRSTFKGGSERVAVLRHCVQHPHDHPCDRPDIAEKVGRASWQAFAAVDYLADMLTSAAVLLACTAIGCAYLAFAFARKS